MGIHIHVAGNVSVSRQQQLQKHQKQIMVRPKTQRQMRFIDSQFDLKKKNNNNFP